MFLILLPLPFTGIIPAHAGLTSAAAAHGLRVEDHPRGCGAHVKPSSGAASRAGSPPPRGCGAHSMDDIKAHMHQGSSPRVRGSLTQIRQNGPLIGIIPADAGLTLPLRTAAKQDRDHPRGCGAHFARQMYLASEKGSSPRMRGSLSSASSRYFFPGIIPAGAGLTYT